MADINDYEIVASPQARAVSVGAVMTFTLVKKRPEAKDPSTLLTWWFVVFPKSAPFWATKTSQPATGRPVVWERVKLDYQGRHRIVCFVDEGAVQFSYDQEVAPLGDVLALGPALVFQADDPNGVLDAVTREIHIIEQIAKEKPPRPGEVEARHKKQWDKLIELRDRLPKRLESTQGKQRFILAAEHFDRETQRRSKLRVFAVRTGRNAWRIVDWTDPTIQTLTGEYDGEYYGAGIAPLAAFDAALAKWKEQNRYPAGAIRIKIPDIPDLGTNIERQFETDGSSYGDSVSTFFNRLGLVAAAVAGVVTLVAPVPGSQVVSAAIWVSIFSSSASAAINIGQRYEEGFNSWKADAFDALTIVGNALGVGAIWKMGAQVTVQTSRGVINAILVGQVGTDFVQGILLTKEAWEQYKAIEADPNLTPAETLEKACALLTNLVVAGLLFRINVKGTKLDAENLTKQPKQFPGPSPKEKLEKLKNPKEKLDLRNSPKAEGHTKDGTHKTTVQVDQEEAAPHVKGTKPGQKPERLAQKTATVNGKPIPPDGQGRVHHGTSQIPPEVALKDGLPAKGDNWDLHSHAEELWKYTNNNVNDSAFRGATLEPSGPPGTRIGAAYWADEGGWVYKIRGVPYWNVNKQLEGRVRRADGTYRGNLMVAEGEFALPARIPPQYIEAWGIVVERRGNLKVDEWHANPNFNPNDDSGAL
ncbi:hypothetical protein LZC95_31145 [Pendulispora brunnea]|uniref:DUF4781 domain-containing protein n=1 Tax=Pendulispora brunnea TaxID=2905690 RepID=A0ABZ2JWQ2_9BACT